MPSSLVNLAHKIRQQLLSHQKKRQQFISLFFFFYLLSFFLFYVIRHDFFILLFEKALHMNFNKPQNSLPHPFPIIYKGV